MTPGLSNLSGSGSFARGLHLADRKEFSAGAPIEVLPAPSRVAIPLLQHAGSPCERVVKTKDQVTLGLLIGKATGPISANVHASIAGTVEMGSVATLPNGRHVRTVPIAAAAQQPSAQELMDDMFGGEWAVDLAKFSPRQIGLAVQEAGIVGLGGAAFPTHVKLASKPDRPIDTLLVNGCECEPYLTSDYRLMLEAPQAIIAGAILAAHAAGASRIVVAIEDNKPLAVEAMRKASSGAAVKVVAVKTKYPMGGERQVIPAILGRKVPTAGLPLDVGVAVINVGTAWAIARAVLRGKPLTHRVVSVAGAGIRRPKNLLVPIGASYADLINACGGLTKDAMRIVAGGPMMGFAIGSLDTPVTKGVSGLTVLTERDVASESETACIRCGRCVDVCPLHLVPAKLAQAVRADDWELARRYHLKACCECGCCAYACPARIPLAQLIRTGKAKLQ